MESKIEEQKAEIQKLNKELEESQDLTEEQKYAAMSEFTKQNMIKDDFVASHIQLLPDEIKAKFEELEKARCSWYEDSLTRYYK